MRAALGNASLFHYIDVVRRRHIGKPMGNQNDRLCPCQRMDLTHDVVFALHIDVRGSLVKDIYRAVVEERSGKSKALTLPSGEITRLFSELGVKPALVFQKCGKVDSVQNRPQLIVGSVRLSHQQIFPHTPLKQIALVTYVGKILHQACFADFGKFHPADLYRTDIALVSSHQNRCDRGFSAARLADNRGKRALRKIHVDAVQDLPIRIIGKMQTVADN